MQRVIGNAQVILHFLSREAAHLQWLLQNAMQHRVVIAYFICLVTSRDNKYPWDNNITCGCRIMSMKKALYNISRDMMAGRSLSDIGVEVVALLKVASQAATYAPAASLLISQAEHVTVHEVGVLLSCLWELCLSPWTTNSTAISWDSDSHRAHCRQGYKDGLSWREMYIVEVKLATCMYSWINSTNPDLVYTLLAD